MTIRASPDVMWELRERCVAIQAILGQRDLSQASLREPIAALRTLQAQQVLINFLSMTRFGCPARHGAEIAFAQAAFEKLEHERVAEVGERGIVTSAFIAHEGVLAVEFVPGEMEI